jgi:hypothetical protein
MNIAKKRLRTSRALLGRFALALVLAGMVGGIAAPARADDDRRHREEWRDHREHEHERDRRFHERHVIAQEPVYVAPPPVVYAPPPPSGINLVFPIQIR